MRRMEEEETEGETCRERRTTISDVDSIEDHVDAESYQSSVYVIEKGEY